MSLQNDVIVHYVENKLSPQVDERKSISDRYRELSNMLRGDNFQSGSYARFTSITPVNDLDVIWVLPEDTISKSINGLATTQREINPDDLDVGHIIHDLADKIETEYAKLGMSPRIKPQSHSIGIYFGKTDEEFSIDIVPAVPSGRKNEQGDDIYLVPEIIRSSKRNRVKAYENEVKDPIRWIESDPRGYIFDAQKLNAQNDSFRKASKIVKKWKSSCKNLDENFPLKSFHLELIVTEIYRQHPQFDSLSGIEYFFNHLEEYLTPQFKDKADNLRYTDAYLDDIKDAQKSLIIRRRILALEIVKQIKYASDASVISSLIADLLDSQSQAKPNITETRIPAYSKPYSL